MWHKVCSKSHLSEECDAAPGLKFSQWSEHCLVSGERKPNTSNWWTQPLQEQAEMVTSMASPLLKQLHTVPERGSSTDLATAEPSQSRPRDEDASEEENSIDELLSQLLKISRNSPNATQDASYESIKNLLSGREEDLGVTSIVENSENPDPNYDRLSLCCGRASHVFNDIADPHMPLNSTEVDLWSSHDNHMHFVEGVKIHMSQGGDIQSPSPGLTPEEEAAICALVPKLVRVSVSKPVRGVYLDRRRGLWRANWREGGKVKTKGFRIAQWGEHEARRKAIEVRKLMETRGCFLKLKAVAMGDASRELHDNGTFARLTRSSNTDVGTFENNTMNLGGTRPNAAHSYMNSEDVTFHPFVAAKYWPSHTWDSSQYLHATSGTTWLDSASKIDFYSSGEPSPSSRGSDEPTTKTETKDNQTLVDCTPSCIESPKQYLPISATSASKRAVTTTIVPETLTTEPQNKKQVLSPSACRRAELLLSTVTRSNVRKRHHRRPARTASRVLPPSMALPTRVLPQRKSRGLHPGRRLEV